jgi:hypothetical protein
MLVQVQSVSEIILVYLAVILNVVVVCCEMTDRLPQQSRIVAPVQPILSSTQVESAVSHAQVAFRRPPPTIGLVGDE